MSSALPNPLPHAASAPDTGGEASFLLNALNDTAVALAGAAIEEIKRMGTPTPEWTGLGLEWIRSWLGAREWRVPCLDVNIRL